MVVNETDIAAYLKNFVHTEEGNLTLFNAHDRKTRLEMAKLNGLDVPYYINEFWTARQRQASSIHEISYRACFKPQLPRFFIKLLSREGDLVYDPFSGRGTTVLEAALLGRRVMANDINPLSKILALPRLAVPPLDAVRQRLSQIPCNGSAEAVMDRPMSFQPGGHGDPPLHDKPEAEMDLSMFFHPDTEAEILSLRNYLRQARDTGLEDDVDRWIRMVATNRLTGHSSGFFSVYTLPPNQAVTAEKQLRINMRRNQQPAYRDTRKLILKKTHSLIKDLAADEIIRLREAAQSAVFLQTDARCTPQISSGSVQLTVTSPPFLDIVQYSQDNWLRCWFNDIPVGEIERQITMARTVEQWSGVMGAVFEELYRITKKDGWVAFEVGEIKRGRIRLDEYIVPLGLAAGFNCEGVIINLQEFTKTSNIWGVGNNSLGTNTNRIVLFRKM